MLQQQHLPLCAQVWHFCTSVSLLGAYLMLRIEQDPNQRIPQGTGQLALAAHSDKCPPSGA